MRKVTVSVQVDAEKLRAIQFYTGYPPTAAWNASRVLDIVTLSGVRPGSTCTCIG